MKAVITTGAKFFGTDQRLYIKCHGCSFIGFIKVGKKRLFIYDDLGRVKELNPLCVLDFYTYEGCQRKGYGKELFTAMIQNEHIEPRKLAFDRPSFNFLNFLKKYYGLVAYVPQNNNFVVFNDYFNDVNKEQPKLLDCTNNKQTCFENANKRYKSKCHQEKENCNESFNKIVNNKQSQIKAYYGNGGVGGKNKANFSTKQYAKTSSEYGSFFNVAD